MLKLPRIFAGLLVFVGAGVGVVHADDAVNASVMAAMAQPTGHIATTKYVRSITDSLNDTVLGTVNKDGEREGGLKQQVTAAAQAAANAQTAVDEVMSLLDNYDPDTDTNSGLVYEVRALRDAVGTRNEMDGTYENGFGKQLSEYERGLGTYNIETGTWSTDEDTLAGQVQMMRQDLGYYQDADSPGTGVKGRLGTLGEAVGAVPKLSWQGYVEEVTNLNTDAKIIVPAINELDAEIEGTLNAETGEREGGLKKQVAAAAQAAAGAKSAADSAQGTADRAIELIGSYGIEGEAGTGILGEIEANAFAIIAAREDAGHALTGVRENLDLMGASYSFDTDGTVTITNLDTEAKTLVPAINELDAEIEGTLNAETGKREGGLKKQVQANTDAIGWWDPEANDGKGEGVGLIADVTGNANAISKVDQKIGNEQLDGRYSGSFASQVYGEIDGVKSDVGVVATSVEENTSSINAIETELYGEIVPSESPDGEPERKGGALVDTVAQIKASLGTVPIKKDGEQTGTVQIWVE